MSAIKKYDPPADIMQLGSVLQRSGFFDDIKSEAQAIVKVMAGAELGFGPIASMTGIHVIKGKVAVGANLIASAIKRSGRYDYRVREHSDTVCEIQFFERGQPIGVSRFTEADARRMQTQNMNRFPKNMLFARALSNGAKWYTPDIFGGPIYTPDELGATINEDGDVLAVPDTAPAPRPLTHPSSQPDTEEPLEATFDPIPDEPPPVTKNIEAPAMRAAMIRKIREQMRQLGDSVTAVEWALDLDEMASADLVALGMAYKERLERQQSSELAAA